MKHLGMIAILIWGSAHALELYQPTEPLQWQMEPHARQSDEVDMEVVPIEGPDRVDYRFMCRTGDAPSSKWQDSPGYTAGGLRPDTAYSFVAYARCNGKAIGLPSSEITVKTRKAGGGENVARIDEAIRKGRLENIPIMVHGDKDNRINLVFINRWQKGQRDAYKGSEMRGDFVKDCKGALKIFTSGDPDAIDPYPEYKNFLNVYGMWWPDVPPEDKKDPKNSMKRQDYAKIRDRHFLPWQTSDRGWVSQIGFFNYGIRGGNATRDLDLRIGDAMLVGHELRGIIHEFSHTAPGCPDEYTSSGMWGFGGEGVTTTSDHRREFCRWRAWIEPDTPVPTPYGKADLDKVGLHEGGVHRMAHLFRPTARGCLMGAGSGSTGRDLCVVCRQRHVMRFYKLVDAIDERSPLVDEITIPDACRMKFRVKRVHPVPDTQKTAWTLNGKVIATGTDAVEVEFTNLDRYELEFSLVDESKYIRPDPPFADYPRASTKWTILNPKATGRSEQMAVSIHKVEPVFAGADNGSIKLSATGGKGPYQYRWADGGEGPGRKGLAPGIYSVTVIDSEFRSTAQQIDLTSPQQLDARIVSKYDGSQWQLCSSVASKAPVSIQWSTGETKAVIARSEEGEVSCELRHRNGCTMTQTITLKRPAKALTVGIGKLAASSCGENNGQVELQIEGGRGPMRYLWWDGLETSSPKREHLYPGKHSVMVRDANGAERSCSFTVESEPAFRVAGLEWERQGDDCVRISNAAADLEYLWFDRDIPGWLPRFPHGIYSGTYTSSSGQPCDVEAYVVQTKGGYYVKMPEKNLKPHHRNDLGYWVHVMIYEDGRKKEPRLLKLDLNESDTGFTLSGSEQPGVGGWTGTVIDGRMTGSGAAGGSFEMRYVSRPEETDAPIATGTICKIPKPGHYYVAARRKSNGAISQNRLGVTIGEKTEAPGAPIGPDAVRSANMLMWLDASDVNGNGMADQPSEIPLRRGAVMGWQGRSHDVNFNGIIFYYPNTLNGLGVASWKTIWVQSLSKPVTGYQTIVMIRREHDLSSVGKAPWQKLSPLIGVGEYGHKLFSTGAAKALEDSRVFIDGAQVDPRAAKMPRDFYVATYEFASVMDQEIRSTEGYWEGEVAECLVFDGKLSDSERRGLEEYLRRKWLSAVDLPFPEELGKR